MFLPALRNIFHRTLRPLTRISPKTYRAIAPAVKDGALDSNRKAIPLQPKKSRKVTAYRRRFRGGTSYAVDTTIEVVAMRFERDERKSRANIAPSARTRAPAFQAEVTIKRGRSFLQASDLSVHHPIASWL